MGLDLDKILRDFAALDDWEDRYGYLIELGMALPPLPDAYRVPAHKVPGCTSQVWLVADWPDDKLQLHMDSDAMIVKGLLALLYAAYVGKTTDEVRHLNVQTLFESLDLEQHLTVNRRNGFAAVNEYIQRAAT